MTGTHERFERANVKLGSDRGFGLVFAALFGLIGLWPLIHHGGVRLWALAPAIAFAAIALTRPRLLNPLNRLWFRFGLLIHAVVSPIVMGLIFVGGIIPTALILRMRGRDPLRLQPPPARDKGSGSTWIVRSPPGPAPQSMKHLF
jgi:hypothetical protein